MSIISKIDASMFILGPGAANALEEISEYANNERWIETTKKIKYAKNNFYTGVTLIATATAAAFMSNGGFLTPALAVTVAATGCIISALAAKHIYDEGPKLLLEVENYPLTRSQSAFQQQLPGPAKERIDSLHPETVIPNDFTTF